MAEGRRRLVRMEDRTAWVYAEMAALGRHEDQLTLVRERDSLIIPSGTLGAVLLGPGTSVTHPGMELLHDNCVSLLWVRGGGLGLYHSSMPPAFSQGSAAVIAQAAAVSDPDFRMEVAQRMYALRFGERLHGMSMTDLRLAEGRRVKKIYRTLAADAGVTWVSRGPGRQIDPVNKNLDVVNHCVAGVSAVVCNTLGMSPALGIIHTGSVRSFIMDLTDLYKWEVAPLAFQAARAGSTDARELRIAVRDWAWRTKVMGRMIADIAVVFGIDSDPVQMVDTNDWWEGVTA